MPQPPEDDDELELEPVDPEVLAAERRRTELKTQQALSSVDVEELVREEVPDDGLGVDWESFRQFRFTTRHLLILTAGLAVLMTLFTQADGCSAIFILGVVFVGGGWLWVLRHDRRIAARRTQRKEELLAGGYGSGMSPPAAADMLDAPLPKPSSFDFKFAFSLKQFFIAFTAAAVMLGFIRIFGADKLSIVLGIIALLGLAANAIGLEAAPIVVFGWWLLLVLYLFVGLISALSGKDEGPQALRAAPTWKATDVGRG